MLRRAGDRRRVVWIVGGGELTTDEKHDRLCLFRGAATSNQGVVAVMNAAGSRGLDHQKLPELILVEPPPTVADLLQIIGRVARVPGQHGRVVTLVTRSALMAAAGVLRRDPEKLALFSEVVAVFEAVGYCWASLLEYFSGDEDEPARAAPRDGCCPACARLFEARDGRAAPPVARVVPQVHALVVLVKSLADATQQQPTLSVRPPRGNQSKSVTSLIISRAGVVQRCPHFVGAFVLERGARAHRLVAPRGGRTVARAARRC
jgi:hypothetical protein